MKLTELTMRVGDLSASADERSTLDKETWRLHPKIADMEEFIIRNEGQQYTVWLKDELVGAASMKRGDPAEVTKIWVSSQFRGKRVLSKLLWFFKTREMQSKLILGPMHSKDTFEVVSKGLKSFTKNWFNIKTKEVIELTLDTLDPKNKTHYSFAGPTDWRIMLEAELFEEQWSFFKSSDFIKDAYGAFVDDWVV